MSSNSKLTQPHKHPIRVDECVVSHCCRAPPAPPHWRVQNVVFKVELVHELGEGAIFEQLFHKRLFNPRIVNVEFDYNKVVRR